MAKEDAIQALNKEVELLQVALQQEARPSTRSRHCIRLTLRRNSHGDITPAAFALRLIERQPPGLWSHHCMLCSDDAGRTDVRPCYKRQRRVRSDVHHHFGIRAGLCLS